ncbi:hemocyanin A chain-like [Schistocerca cancellata]|uniref:hemocyanin A chain-like n=1 Tax=Schistocerca cancellata TaxID=274614 RepID=UPI0021190DA3|nr:hemocyanin A chain-like [Schistocerca cancellata]
MRLMWLAVLVVAVALGGAQAGIGDVPADKPFLMKQREVLRLFNKVHEPNRYKEQVELGNAYEPLNSLPRYRNPAPVKQLVRLYRAGSLLPRGAIFTLFDDTHREQMILLFESLLYANDWETFLRTAAWARDRVNEGQFVYALCVAVLHREDTRGVVLPPPYEIYPHLFVNSEVIHAAYKAKMRQEPAVVHMNFTGTIRNPEQRVAYLGEDLGMNSHHSQWHMDFPFWWKEDEYGIRKERKGELFYYMHHQLIARFDLERLSNDLPFVEPLYWTERIKDGFYPQTTYRVGGEFPARPDNFAFHDLQNVKVQQMIDYTRRVRECISQQAVITETGDLYNISSPEGINVLGELIEPSTGSKHREYYGALHNYGHIMLGQITDPKRKFNMPPGVMEHFETATRDPAFFRLHKYIDNLFYEHKDLLPRYTWEELELPGTSIEEVQIDPLETFFEYFDVDLLNALDDTEELPDVSIHARVRRLNHKPFVFSVRVNSEAERLVTVRVFLGPKYDWFGQEIPINDKRHYIVEIDKFVAKVNAGKTVITRKSSESSVTIPDRETTKVLTQRVEDAISGKIQLTVNKDVRHCGYPDRLLLPKGRRDGMPFTLFVVLTDYEKDKVNDLPFDYDYGGSVSYCGTLGHRYPDAKPMGFPFDRRIDQDSFFTKNIYQRDVTITFKGSV